MENNREFWSIQQVIPVVVIEDVKHAVPLAHALVDGGMSRIEITLRTAAALDSIAKIRSEVPEAFVGAGTVLNQKNLNDAIAAGSQFIVSPGSTEKLRVELANCGVPALPGAATVSEAMALMQAGFSVAKFFPASDIGGVKMLKSISTVLQDIAFCPTGGITAETAPEFLELPNVVCVGGSWVASKGLIKDENWSEITRLAKEATKKARN